LRKRIWERVPVLERVIKERIEAGPLLGKVKEVSSAGLLLDVTDESYSFGELSPEEARKLRRLSMWMAEGEKEIEVPEDDVPF